MITPETPGRGLVPHSDDQTGIRIMSAGISPVFDWSNLKVKNTFGFGTNQGSSSSCQTHATAIAFKRSTGLDISKEFIYSNIALPGGGGYLIAPAQFISGEGYLLTSKYPDPSPETEANMTQKLDVLNVDTMKFITCISSIQSTDTIDSVASAIMSNDAAVIGLWWTGTGWAKSWTNPTFTAGDLAEGHALCTSNPIIYNGLHAIECETSWYNTIGPDGPCQKHIIDQNFFANGGVFELLTLNFTNNDMQLIKDKGTVYLVATDKSFKVGIGDPATLAMFGDEAVSDGDTSTIPQTYTLASGIIAHKV